MKFSKMVKADYDVTHILANMEVRYWEDAIVNGAVEQEDAPSIPLRSDKNDAWIIKVDLSSGKIEGWPDGTTAETHYKVCDAGVYSLISQDGTIVAEKSGYVPDMLSPNDNGFGDYVILSINENGVIDGFKPDLSYFNGEE